MLVKLALWAEMPTLFLIKDYFNDWIKHPRINVGIMACNELSLAGASFRLLLLGTYLCLQTFQFSGSFNAEY